MSMDWQSEWERLASRFDSLTEEVREGNPVATSQRGRTATEHFPFGAYLTFSRNGIAGEEDLVVSVDCRATGESLAF